MNHWHSFRKKIKASKKNVYKAISKKIIKRLMGI